MGFFNKIAEGLKKTRDSMMGKVDALLNSFTKIDEEFFEELEENLIMADVGAVTSSHICENLRKKVKEKGLTDASEVKGALKEIISEMLSGDEALNLSTKPSVLLVIGVNGVGKTTTIGKLANNLRQDGKKVLLAAADTFRAAAIDQLQIWADRAQVELVKHDEGSDPAAVVSMQSMQARHAAVMSLSVILQADCTTRRILWKSFARFTVSWRRNIRKHIWKLWWFWMERQGRMHLCRQDSLQRWQM